MNDRCAKLAPRLVLWVTAWPGLSGVKRACRIVLVACMAVLALLANDARGTSDEQYRDCGALCSEAFWAGASAEDVRAEFSRSPGALSYRGHLLRLAVSSGGSSDAVKALLRAGAPPNLRFEGEPWDGYGNRTVLQEAARRDADVVSVLLSFGALPHLADGKRRTPLHDSVEAGLTRAVTFLLQAGADPRAVDAEGVTPAELAERLDNDAMRFLLRTVRAPPPCGRLCDPEFWKTATAEQLAEALARGPYTRERSQRGDAPLHVALTHSRSKAVKVEFRMTGLAPSVRVSMRFDIGILELLLDHGMDPNARNARDETPLHIAARGYSDAVFNLAFSHTAAIRALLKRGAMVDPADGQDRTPLEVAAHHAEIGAMRLFLEAGANPDVLGGAFFNDAGKLELPDKELEQIIVYGYYEPENPHRLDEFEQEVIRQGRLRPGETFEEKYKSMLDSRNENFYFRSLFYCHNRRPKQEMAFKDNLRIRLHDKDGKLLAEDLLRLDGPALPTDDRFFIVAYLPYHPAAHEMRIVNTQRKAPLFELSVLSNADLREWSDLYAHDRLNSHIGWTYRLRSQCYVAPPTR